MQWHRLCPVEAIPLGGMRAFAAGGRRIVVCRCDEGLFALDDECPHATALLHEGRLRGRVLSCPMHGARFDVRDGRVLRGPATESLTRWQVRETDGHVDVLLQAREATPGS